MIYRYYEYGTDAIHDKTGMVFPVYFGATKSEEDECVVICVKCKYFYDSDYNFFKIKKERMRTWADFEKACEAILETMGCRSISKKWSWDVKGYTL